MINKPVLQSAAVALFLFGWAGSLGAQKVPVIERSLSNGMRLLMVERPDEPTVAGGWVARVGASNERPGITGIAHLFEHMMFKGTPTIGTKDYKKDLEIMAEQERIRDLMRAEEAKMRAMWRRGEIEDLTKIETKTPRWKELEKQFNELIVKHREVLVKNEFDRIYTTAGGTGMNAFTSSDMTAYHITVPANKLELWMWMESERILRPVFREFYAERDVVYEERRMRTESTPLGKFAEAFESLFWESHPYGWPVIGWPSDIPAISKAQADEFYQTYYAPQNITLILIGDFKAEEATKQAESYFGRIPAGKQEAPDVVTLEVKQVAEKRMFAEADANPQVDIYWHTVAFGHRDSYPLAVLAQVLSTHTGRLYKGLVLGAKVATETFAWNAAQKWAGMFNAGGEVTDGHTPEEVEKGIYAELERLKTELVPANELQKVKNNFAAGEYRRLSANHPILMQLIQYEGRGDWHEINDSGPRIQAVTPADIQRVVRDYFTKENRAVGIYTRKPGKSGGADDDLAGLTPEQKPVIRQITGALQKETNAEKLAEQLKKLEERMASADAKNKPFLTIYRKKLQERLAELNKK